MIRQLEGVIPTEDFAKQTPLEVIFGFQVAEETYDLLNEREQIMIDLLCAGWNQTHIALLFDISQPSVSSAIRRIRFKLANTRMRLILETRRDIRH